MIENTIEHLKDAEFGTPEWDKLEQIIKSKRRLCELYGIGTKINTPDGIGTILSIYGRAVEVSLKSIKTTQVLHGFSKGNGGLHRTYLFKDYDCPLELTPLSMITDEHAIEVARILKPNDDHHHDSKTGKYLIRGLENTMQTFPKYFKLINFLISKGYYVGDGTEISYNWCVLKTDK